MNVTELGKARRRRRRRRARRRHGPYVMGECLHCMEREIARRAARGLCVNGAPHVCSAEEVGKPLIE